MKILAINAGSNSLKFEIIQTAASNDRLEDGQFGTKLLSGAYDDVGKQDGTFALFDGKRTVRKQSVRIDSYEHSAELLVGWIQGGGAGEYGIRSFGDVQGIGHRIVHGGDRFSKPVKIDEGVLREIDELSDLAPLHNASALSVIRAVQKRLGPKLPAVAVFDTLFHQTIPDEAALYPLPLEISQKHRIRRYGFHGISHRYLTMRYSQLANRPLDQVNIITLHLEGGSSAAAIRGGRSVDTSMGFTPLEGLMMGTRTGDIDPALVLYLMRKENLDAKGVETLLNRKSGLLGVSGRSQDTRELRKHLEEKRTRLAFQMFSYRVRKYIGAYMAALGGAEAVIFGGGIGENTPEIREQICAGLEWLGVELDPDENSKVVDREGVISKPESRVHLWVIPTEEALMLAHETAHCL